MQYPVSVFSLQTNKQANKLISKLFIIAKGLDVIQNFRQNGNEQATYKRTNSENEKGVSDAGH